MDLSRITVPVRPYGEALSFNEARADSPTFAREFKTHFLLGREIVKREPPLGAHSSVGPNNWEQNYKHAEDSIAMECWALPAPSSDVWSHWRIVSEGTTTAVRDHTPAPLNTAWHSRSLPEHESIPENEFKFGKKFTYRGIEMDGWGMLRRTSDPAKVFMRIKPTEIHMTEALAEKLMPKLDEIQGLLADETHAKVLGIDQAVRETQAEFPEIKETLNLIRKKSGRADARLDQMEDHVIELDGKLDALRDDVHEIKGALAEICVALKSASLVSRKDEGSSPPTAG